jgi:hypothetical protein
MRRHRRSAHDGRGVPPHPKMPRKRWIEPPKLLICPK